MKLSIESAFAQHRFFHLAADSSLSEFLTEEISTERNNMKKATPIPGFTVTADGAELVFTKDLGIEK